MRRLTLIACALAPWTGISAQSPSPDMPEIRRAIPIQPENPAGVTPQTFENPAWMEQIPPREPEGRIEVMPHAEPANANTPAPEAAQPETPPAPPPPADDPNTIRLSPAGNEEKDAAARQFDKANSIYARKMYDFAIMEYERFLSAYPQAPGRDAAWFRLGESHRAAGDSATARKAFERLAKEFHEGEFLGAGSYRLGEMLFAESQYEEALRLFETAIANAGSPEIRLSAQYQAGRCLDRLGRPGEATAKFREVADVEGPNPYRDYARLALAGALAAGGQKSESLGAYEKILKAQVPPLLRAETLVKAGSLAAELKEQKKAAEYFRGVLDIPEAGKWRGVALLGLVRMLGASGEYDALLAIPESDLDALTGDYKAEALSWMAAAHRAKGATLKAREIYDRVASEFPKSRTARSTRFARIVVLHELSDARTRKELDAFLADAQDSPDRDRGRLLLAERLFQEGNHAEAAKAYAAVLESNLNEDLKSQARFKYAWCLARGKDPQKAIQVFNAVLETPASPEIESAALAQRGLLLQKTRQFQPALADFEKILTKWPQAPERELALQQKALALGEMKDYPAMRTAFDQFLSEFPKSQGAAQAEYWLGWADFEAKNYAAALPHFQRARQGDAERFGERAGLRVALCHYYAADYDALAATVAQLRTEVVPREIHRWLGLRAAQGGHFTQAEGYLSLAAAHGNLDPDALIVLAEARNVVGKRKEALEAAQAYLEQAKEPAQRARGLLAIAESHRGLAEFDAAREVANEALELQPEGRLNAAGRMTLGEIEASQKNYEAAAKAFMTVALLYDDPTITPRALQRAAENYRKGGQTEEAGKAEAELASRFPNLSGLH